MRQRRWKRIVERDNDPEGQLNYNDGVSTIKTVIHPQFLQTWNTIFVVSCVIAVSVDPLFLYVPVLDEVKKCIEMDKTLRITAICFRAVTDLIYVVNAILQFYSQKLGSPKLVTDASKTGRRYLQGYFLIDILAILPLPQVVIPLLFTNMRGAKSSNIRIFLNSVVLFQYVPRVLRLYLSQKVLYTETATDPVVEFVILAKGAFKFSLYILASHVVGACWYFFSIERKTACWRIACENHIECVRSSFKCDTSLGNYTFLNDFCTVNTTTRDTTFFDFGIFLDALQSGILESRDFPQKFTHCFWWGLRNLSSLGQNLQTSTYIWETCFAVFISIFGLLVFLSLVGTLQTFIQLETEGLKNVYIQKMEIRRKKEVKERDVRLWMSRHNLPDNLKERILRNVQCIMEVSLDIDLENPLPYLRAELRRDIQHHLFLTLLKRVPMFEEMDEQLLDATCDRLKQELYVEESYIVREGDPVDEMLFIMRGKLLTMTTDGGGTGYFNRTFLKAGDFCGEELITWALYPHSSSNLPISTRTVQALSEVEAFALKAEDLKFVASQFRRLHSKQLRHTFRLNSQYWRTWAACFIQKAWRRYTEKKLEDSLRAEENRLQDALAKAGGSSPSLGATIYASRFAANSLRALRRNNTRKAG